MKEIPLPFVRPVRGGTSLLALTCLLTLVFCSQSQAPPAAKKQPVADMAQDQMPTDWYDMKTVEIPLDQTEGVSPN